RWRDGVLGAAVAAVVIEILKIGFAIYIGTWSSYQTVYGAIAAIPIFLLWMYVSWMAVLLGAVVAANLATWRVDERPAHLSRGGGRAGRCRSPQRWTASSRPRRRRCGSRYRPCWPTSAIPRQSRPAMCRYGPLPRAACRSRESQDQRGIARMTDDIAEDEPFAP